MSEITIGFIGAGQMARALACGFATRQLVQRNRIVAFDPSPPAQAQFLADVDGAKWVASNSQVVREADTVIVAVKPQSFADVSRELESTATKGKLFVSIMAGVSLATLSKGVKSERVIRVMPNTPCLVGQGAAAYALGAAASAEDSALVEKLFRAVGIAVELPEKLLDAVTGLSGSGPAYVYVLIEALSDGGVRMGLPRAVATQLAAQTVLGAAQMVMTSGEHPGVLKDRVASPAGTTIAGLQVLERRGVRSALLDAVEAATVRSQELGSKE